MAPRKTKNKISENKEPPEAENAEKRYANLREAAAHCHVSEVTLSNYVWKYPDLPVVEKSATKNGYKIDLDELDKWREKYNKLNWNPRGLRGESQNGELPLQITDANRKTRIEADLLQLKYDREAGKLVLRDDIVKMLSTRMAQFAKRHEALPTILGRKLGWNAEAIEACRREMDIARYAMVANDEGYFSGPIEVADASSQ